MKTYEDCRLAIDNYKRGPCANSDAQGLMNFLCGALYALDGEVSAVGENVYIASARATSE